MAKYIRHKERDNICVVTAADGVSPGDKISDIVTAKDPVPQGHKIALSEIDEGAAVRRYGEIIGYAKRNILPGERVQHADLQMPEPPVLAELSYSPAAGPVSNTGPSASDETVDTAEYFFEGYRNADGTVGTRNILGISTCVQCTAGVVDILVREIREKLLPEYPHVDDVVAINHGYGCGVAIDAPGAAVPIRTIANLSRNPNLGDELMIVSLGCEKLQPEKIRAGLAPAVNSSFLVLQDPKVGGFTGMIAEGLRQAEIHLKRANTRRREKCSVSDLVVGVQCGGSDAFSGVTANPVIGAAADLIVKAGGTVVFSEITEVRDVADVLAARAADEQVFTRLVEGFSWYDNYLNAGGADRSANTTPGNKAGGLANITEKALGSVEKSGSSLLSEVLFPGERLSKKGLAFIAGPAGDFVCGTLELAAGMNVHIFSTGRGTPYGLAMCPVIKVSTRTELAQQWPVLIDFNAGRILDEGRSITELGHEMFLQILETAGGRKTCTEILGIVNEMVLFNPGPVT